MNEHTRCSLQSCGDQAEKFIHLMSTTQQAMLCGAHNMYGAQNTYGTHKSIEPMACMELITRMDEQVMNQDLASLKAVFSGVSAPPRSQASYEHRLRLKSIHKSIHFLSPTLTL